VNPYIKLLIATLLAIITFIIGMAIDRIVANRTATVDNRVGIVSLEHRVETLEDDHKILKEDN